jgi:hypothetical protein
MRTAQQVVRQIQAPQHIQTTARKGDGGNRMVVHSTIVENIGKFGLKSASPQECMAAAAQPFFDKATFTAKTHGYALTSKAPLGPYAFERRISREHDVAVDIQYCGDALAG